jgi:hypothetical protein
MGTSVSISFECKPLRSITRWDVPLDAAEEQQQAQARVRQAAQRHGLHNSYYLSNGFCECHLTNDPAVGLLVFRFEGTVLTDQNDRRTHSLDLHVQLDAEICDWLTAPAVEWFRESVRQAVRVEFDHYIESRDLERARQRLDHIEADMVDCGGFVAVGV